MSDYATPTEIAAAAQEFTIDPDYALQLATAASRFFDNLCEVEEGFFAAATSESDKTFYGNGTAYLPLGPYVGPLGVDPIVILDSDNNEQTVPDYYEQNGFLVIKGFGSGVPIKNVDNSPIPIFGSPWNTTSPNWDTRAAAEFVGWPRNLEITVSANWGFTSIPADVKQATIQLAIHLFRTNDSAFTAISQSGQPYSPPDVPKQVQAISDRYRQRFNQNALFA